MKKITIVLFAAAALLLACTKEQNSNDQQQDNVALDTTNALKAIIGNDLTKTTLGSDGKVVWSSGDKITVFSNANPAGIEYTLIGTGGTATAYFSPTSGTAVTGDPTYAIYGNLASGAQITSGKIDVDFGSLASQGTRVSTVVSTPTDAVASLPLAGVYTSGKLVFSNLCGGFKLQIANTQRADYQVKRVSVTGTGLNLSGTGTVTLGASPSVALASGDAKASAIYATAVPVTTDGSFIVFVPAGKYPSGLTFEIEDSQGRVVSKTRSSSVTVTAGQVIPLKEFPINFYYGTANCYTSVESGTISVDVTPYYSLKNDYTYENARVKNADGTDYTPTLTPKVIWELKGDGVAIKSGDIISGTPTISGTTMSVTLTANRGNAIIAITDASDNILWSYHIWSSGIPLASFSSTYKVSYDNTQAIEAATLMDRNLGATANVLKTTTKPFGMYYQWGRKDPFPAKADMDGQVYDLSKPRIYYPVDELTPNVIERTNENGNIAYAVQHPDTRIVIASTGGNWCLLNDPTLWGGAEAATEDVAPLKDKSVKTIFDPCPSGWRVADVGAYPSKMTTAQATYSSTSYGRTFNSNFFSEPGYLEPTTKGINLYQTRGYYWTNSCLVGTYCIGYYFYFNKDADKTGFDAIYLKSNTDYRNSTGMPLRCQKIE